MEFEPYAAFSRIDRNNHTVITAKDISTFLKSCDIEESISDCNLITKYYDSDPNSHLEGSMLSF